VRLFAGRGRFLGLSCEGEKEEKMKDDAGFLRDIVANPNDPVPRLIYADWLDEQGDSQHLKGEFLRLDCELAEKEREGTAESTGERAALRQRLLELRAEIDPGWLALLDRTGIENCGQGRGRSRRLFEFEYECPRRWEALRVTADDRVRFCDSCNQKVYHCASIEEAQAQARRGRCVALDSRVELTPGVRITPRRHFPRPNFGRRMGRIRPRGNG
jgi:uncharacterized protein (TIGR02996 family)